MASDPQQPQMKKTLGLTGLTMNAMALIAPGAFLWLTFASSASTAQPMAGCAVWFGIVVALLLCFATAIAYAELSKLYPGAGSSYFFAEQAFLSKTQAYRFARLAKFIIGWASHLYYWVYPGVMVGVTAILVGYLAGQLWPDTFNGTINSPTLMIGFCVLFAFGVASIAYRGVTGTTGVNVAINVIQIAALLVFSVIAVGYRLNHHEGSRGLHARSRRQRRSTWCWPSTRTATPIKAEKPGEQTAYKVEQDSGKDKPLMLIYGAAASPRSRSTRPSPTARSRTPSSTTPRRCRWFRRTAFSFAIIQACIAILILVGFESVTSLGRGGEERQARHSPRRAAVAVHSRGRLLLDRILCRRLLPQSRLSDGDDAAGSSAPIGDMMVLAGTWLFGSQRAGWWFMFIEAITVLPGPDRHHAVVHHHRRPGDVRHGPRRRSALALRHVARPEPDAAPGDLDAGLHFGGDRHLRRADVPLRPGAPDHARTRR